MLKIAMSAAASNLLRAVIARARVRRNRILLMDVRSVEWQSLTFVGERHHFELRVPAPNSGEVVERLCNGLEDAEFRLPGLIVADITVCGEPARASDGATSVTIEALTIDE
jgi:hypothetical protein